MAINPFTINSSLDGFSRKDILTLIKEYYKKGSIRR